MRYAATLFIIAILAAIFAIFVVAVGAIEIATTLPYVFLSLFVACLMCGLMGGKG